MKLAKLAVFELGLIYKIHSYYGLASYSYKSCWGFFCIWKIQLASQQVHLSATQLALACQLASCFGPCVLACQLTWFTRPLSSSRLNLAPNNNGCLLRVNSSYHLTHLFTVRTCKLTTSTTLRTSQLFLHELGSVFIPQCLSGLFKRSLECLECQV